MNSTSRRRTALPMALGWAGLLAYFPLILLFAPGRAILPATLPGLGVRILLFHGVGLAWSTALVVRGGGWPRLRPLLNRPGWGILQGLAAFALAGLGATLLLHLAGGDGAHQLGGLLRPFDFSPLLAGQAPPHFGAERVLRAGLVVFASVAEEWIFRCALWARWLDPPSGEGGERSGGALARALALLALVSFYFALLHLPQGAGAFAQALLGSFALGGLLWWRRNLALIATLHALFNWPLFFA